MTQDLGKAIRVFLLLTFVAVVSVETIYSQKRSKKTTQSQTSSQSKTTSPTTPPQLTKPQQQPSSAKPISTNTTNETESTTLFELATNAGAQPFELAGHGFAPVGGTRLFYEVKGTGPALVLIHGGQMDGRMWDDQFAVLAKQFTVIRYDVRGYGGSFQPDQLYSDADDLAGLLDYLKVKNAHVVGLSLGGRIAIDFALAHPKRVKSLTLAGPGLAGYDAPNSEEADVRMWNLVKAARDDGPEKVTELWLKDPFMAPAMEQARLVPRLQRLARENAHCWLGNPVLQRSPKPLAAKRLDEIKVPTLLILGNRDVPQAQATIETLEKGIRGSKKVVIKGAGHMVNMEKPEEFNEALLAFLGKLP